MEARGVTVARQNEDCRRCLFWSIAKANTATSNTDSFNNSIEELLVDIGAVVPIDCVFCNAPPPHTNPEGQSLNNPELAFHLIGAANDGGVHGPHHLLLEGCAGKIFRKQIQQQCCSRRR